MSAETAITRYGIKQFFSLSEYTQQGYSKGLLDEALRRFKRHSKPFAWSWSWCLFRYG